MNQPYFIRYRRMATYPIGIQRCKYEANNVLIRTITILMQQHDKVPILRIYIFCDLLSCRLRELDGKRKEKKNRIEKKRKENVKGSYECFENFNKIVRAEWKERGT